MQRCDLKAGSQLQIRKNHPRASNRARIRGMAQTLSRINLKKPTDEQTALRAEIKAAKAAGGSGVPAAIKRMSRSAKAATFRGLSA